MKRIVSIALVVLMVAALIVGCSKANAEGKYVVKTLNGKTVEDYFKEELGDGETIDSLLEILGIASLEEYITLEVKADGTAKMVLAGDDEAEGTWKLDGNKFTLTVDGESVEGTLKGSELTLTIEGQECGMVKK